MPINEPRTDAELAAYIAGHLSTARSQDIDRWIATDPANADRVRTFRLLLTASAAPMEWDRARIWSNVRGAIDREQAGRSVDPARHTPPAQPTGWSRSRMLLIARVAAAILVVVTGALYLGHLAPWSTSATAPQLPAHDYVTGRGERATVQLGDGSRVTLAPESQLHVSAGYGARDRSVELEGEAEFDVVHDPTREFSVRAGRARIVDIGTRFDLRAYAGDSSARVAVAEGAVTLGSSTNQAATSTGNRGPEGVLIRAGEMGRLDPLGHASSGQMGSAEPYFAWTQGRLVFERAPLRDVLATIARWYDVDVRVPDAAMADRLVTAGFSTQSPPEMIRALAQAVNASWPGLGATITLVPR